MQFHTSTCHADIGNWWPRYHLLNFPYDQCHCIILVVSQLCYRWWLGAVRKIALTRADVDQILCHYVASYGHNELISKMRTADWQNMHNACHLFREHMVMFDIQQVVIIISPQRWNSHIGMNLQRMPTINILRPRQNGRHFSDDIPYYISL